MSLLTRHRRTAPAVHRLSGLGGEPRLVADALALIREAGMPYHDWLLGGERAVLAALAESVGRQGSEFAAERVRLLLRGGRVAAVVVAHGGEELGSARKADTLAAIAGAHGDREALVGRLRAASRLFLPVEPDAFYLSRIGVRRELRGRGYGRDAMEAYLELGAASGFGRFRLDVSAGNERAIALYRSFGFEVLGRRDHEGMSYLRLGLDELDP